VARARSRPLGPPPDDPGDLPDLPSVELADVPLWRIHRSSTDPLALASDPFGRFNLARPRGTVYAAEEQLGAFVEVFGRLAIIDATDLRAYRLSELRAPGARVADLTRRGVLGRVGLTAEIHTTTDYELTRAWAAAVASQGLDGIRYRARHDPAAKLTSLALFGRRGKLKADVVETSRIPTELVREAELQFELIAAPRRLPRR